MYKTIEDFPRYEINEKGHIRDIKTKRTKSIHINAQGYYEVRFKKKGKTHAKKLHRILAHYFLEPPNQELEDYCTKHYPYVVCVNHIDHDKLNNSLDNLEWCTHQYNSQESWRLGNTPSPKGELNGRATLTEDKVHEICKSFEEGMTPSVAVVVYNISRSQATKIKAGHAWVHISSQYNIQVNKRKKKN